MIGQGFEIAPGTTQLLCGIIQGVSLPRVIEDLSNISIGFNLRGEQYLIREFEPNDASAIDAIAKRISARGDFQQFYLLKGEDPGRTVVELAEASRSQELRPEAKLAVVSPEGTVIGYVSVDIQPILHESAAPEFGDIGYFIDPAESGKGVITTAIRTVLDLGFQELQFPYVNATVDPTNTRSVAVLERLGGVTSGEPYWVEKYQAMRQAFIIFPEKFYLD